MTATAPAQAAPQRGKEVSSYAAASIPEPFIILGLKLKPFTLDHYDLLRRFDCAFVQEDAGYAAYKDLTLGVLVCSMWPEEFLEFMQQPDFAKQVKAWGKKVGMWDFKPKAELFQKYLKQGWQQPPHIRKGSSTTGGDWAHNVRTTLRARQNYSPFDFSRKPMSQAMADYYKLAESDGVIQLLSEEDLKEGETNKAAMDELMSMLGGECPA